MPNMFQSIRLLYTAIVLATVLSGCFQPATRVDTHEMLNATLWQQSSAEYVGTASQAYRMARINLDQALADTSWTAALEQTGDYADLPPAIMLDVDETVLDNTPYEVRIITKLGQYSQESFADWCHSENAPLVPGAKNFLDYAANRGIAVFYYSARRDSLRSCTTRNLRELGLPLPDDSRLLLNNGMSKSEYRTRVSGQYRILLLIGDNLEDFMDGSKSEPATRRDLARRYGDRWGQQWIVLPNPIYGHWESSCYNFDYRLPRDEQLRLKMQELTE